MAGEVVTLRQGDDRPQEEALRLPFNDEVEQALLAALLQDNDVYDHLSGLRAEHFFDGLHADIFAKAATLIERGKPANALALTPYFRNHPALSEIGATTYLANLQTAVVSLLSAPDYARTLMDLHRRREIIRAVTEANEEASRFDLDVTAEQIADSLSERLYQVQETGRQDRPLVSLGEAARAVQQRVEAAARGEVSLDGITTGLIDLDELVGGMRPGQLVVLAGRPSMGKTALATQIGFDNARRRAADPETGTAVLFVSQEMSDEELATRVLAERIGASSRSIAGGRLSAERRLDLMRAAEGLADFPFFIDDRPSLTVQAVRTRARQLKRKMGLGLIVVDYLQLLTAPQRGRDPNRVQEVSEISAGLKGLAKDLGVPVLALSQLSRQVEARDDKRPQLADLRESGSIEQDADIVLFVYRHEYYLEKAEPREGITGYQDKHDRWKADMERWRGVCEVIQAKHRHSATGTAKILFNKTTTSFTSLHHQQETML